MSKIFIYFILNSLDFFIKENVVSLFHWELFVLNFDFVSKKYKLCQYHCTSEHGKQYFFDEKVQRFQNKVYKYFSFLLGGSKSFLLLFVYEHAHLTADYRGRDLVSLRHRRMGKANSHGYLLLSVWSGKIDKRLE